MPGGPEDHAGVFDALQEAELRTRAILDTAADGIIVISQSGIIQSFNPAAERIFGYAAAGVLGLNVNVLMPESYHSGAIAGPSRSTASLATARRSKSSCPPPPVRRPPCLRHGGPHPA